MDLVGAALRGDLHLRAAEAAIFSIVAVRDDLHVLHRVFARSDDRRATPYCADRTDSVDGDTVRLILPASCIHLRTVFRLEDTRASSSRSTRALRTRSGIRPAACRLRSVAKNPRG